MSDRTCGGCGRAGAAWAHPALPGVAACGAACALACAAGDAKKRKPEDDPNPEKPKKARGDEETVTTLTTLRRQESGRATRPAIAERIEGAPEAVPPRADTEEGDVHFSQWDPLGGVRAARAAYAAHAMATRDRGALADMTSGPFAELLQPFAPLEAKRAAIRAAYRHLPVLGTDDEVAAYVAEYDTSTPGVLAEDAAETLARVAAAWRQEADRWWLELRDAVARNTPPGKDRRGAYRNEDVAFLMKGLDTVTPSDWVRTMMAGRTPWVRPLATRALWKLVHEAHRGRVAAHSDAVRAPASAVATALRYCSADEIEAALAAWRAEARGGDHDGEEEEDEEAVPAPATPESAQRVLAAKTALQAAQRQFPTGSVHMLAVLLATLARATDEPLDDSHPRMHAFNAAARLVADALGSASLAEADDELAGKCGADVGGSLSRVRRTAGLVEGLTRVAIDVASSAARAEDGVHLAVANARDRLATASAALAAALPPGVAAGIEARAAALRALVADTSTLGGLAAARAARAAAMAEAAAAGVPADQRLGAGVAVQLAGAEPERETALLLRRIRHLEWKAEGLALVDAALGRGYQVTATWQEAQEAVHHTASGDARLVAVILLMAMAVQQRADIDDFQTVPGLLSDVAEVLLRAVDAGDVLSAATVALHTPEAAWCADADNTLLEFIRDAARERAGEGVDTLRELAALQMHEGLTALTLDLATDPVAGQLRGVLPQHRGGAGGGSLLARGQGTLPPSHGDAGGGSFVAREQVAQEWAALAAFADAALELGRACRARQALARGRR